jgi:FO synthase subunit 2
MKNTIPDDIIQQAYEGNVTKKNALKLLEVPPLQLFSLADRLRKQAVGDDVTYVVNRNINFTDQCIGNCGFCAFRNQENYFLEKSDIIRKTKEAVELGATEVCIQGGLLEDANLEFYQDILSSIKANYPNIHIHAYSPMEVFHLAKKNGLSIESTIKKLKNSGLETMPGTAAEILSDRVREIICPGKLNTLQWENVITTAHRLGIATTATMMYGHVETKEERIDHILKIREIQQKTAGFTEFVLLPFMPYNNPIGKKMIKEGKYATGGIEDLQFYALSRILLHTHIPNIQASWVKLGKKLAQVALTCGANDVGGTLMEEKISSSAGAKNGENMEVSEIKWLVRTAGRKPVQRNTLYESIETENDS